MLQQYAKNDGFDVEFLDAPAKPLNLDESMREIRRRGEDTELFVIDTSTPSIYSDIAFADLLKLE